MTSQRRFFILLLLALGALVGACGGETPPSPSAPPSAVPPPPAISTETAGAQRVVFLGDSLTAGYGLAEEQAFPAVLGELLAAEGTPIRVINAGVSGDTSAGGLARLDWLLRQRPDVLVVGLGANDGLRALDLGATEANLRQIVVHAREAGVRVLLLGMKVPPNYGPDYAGEFEALYPRLASELDVPLVPFLLEGVGGVAELNQADGIHPTAEGQRRVAAVVLPYLHPLVAPTAAEGEKKAAASR